MRSSKRPSRTIQTYPLRSSSSKQSSGQASCWPDGNTARKSDRGAAEFGTKRMRRLLLLPSLRRSTVWSLATRISSCWNRLKPSPSCGPNSSSTSSIVSPKPNKRAAWALWIQIPLGPLFPSGGSLSLIDPFRSDPTCLWPSGEIQRAWTARSPTELGISL